MLGLIGGGLSPFLVETFGGAMAPMLSSALGWAFAGSLAGLVASGWTQVGLSPQVVTEADEPRGIVRRGRRI